MAETYPHPKTNLRVVVVVVIITSLDKAGTSQYPYNVVATSHQLVQSGTGIWVVRDERNLRNKTLDIYFHLICY
jgi:hypothetical protein